MPETKYLLLGPEGKSADVVLPDDVRLDVVRDAIARALDLPPGHALVLRREDGAIIDQSSSLAMSRVRSGARVLVEPARSTRLGGRLGRRRARPEESAIASGYRVLPCYLVVDTSLSMQGDPIDKVNDELPRLRLSMLREPELTEVCQLSLITFDVSAKVHLKLTDVSKMIFKPLRAEGSRTNYSEPFELLRNTIAKDLYELHKSGRRPYRPAVFFLSDGKNNGPGDWHESLGLLTDQATFHGAPNIIAFGFGQATEQSIREVGRKAAYMPAEGSPSAKLDTFMTFLLSSLTTSMAHAAHDQDDVLVVPASPPAGWRAVRIQR